LQTFITSTFFSERYMSSSVRLSSNCLSSVTVRSCAPYSGDWNFRHCFYAVWYIGHPWPFGKNFTEIVPGIPSIGGLNTRGVVEYGDFGPIERYFSQRTVKLVESRLFVCPSVCQTRGLWQNERNLCPVSTFSYHTDRSSSLVF